MTTHNDLGRKGEMLAEDYLRKKGFEIVDRNWTHKRIEIDIIATNQEFIVFIEVKTRSTQGWGMPEEAVSDKKIRRIVEAADFYLNEKNINKPARFDIISIILNDNKTDILHIEDAFMAPLN